MKNISPKIQKAIIKNFLRVSLTGKDKSPPFEKIVESFNPKEVINRILQGLKKLDEFK